MFVQHQWWPLRMWIYEGNLSQGQFHLRLACLNAIPKSTNLQRTFEAEIFKIVENSQPQFQHWTFYKKECSVGYTLMVSMFSLPFEDSTVNNNNVASQRGNNNCILANRPDFIRTVLIFDLRNLRKSGRPNFPEFQPVTILVFRIFSMSFLCKPRRNLLYWCEPNANSNQEYEYRHCRNVRSIGWNLCTDFINVDKFGAFSAILDKENSKIFRGGMPPHPPPLENGSRRGSLCLTCSLGQNGENVLIFYFQMLASMQLSSMLNFSNRTDMLLLSVIFFSQCGKCYAMPAVDFLFSNYKNYERWLNQGDD